MHIGLIGGIGPSSTEFYYRGLVAAHAAAGRKLELTIVHAHLPDLRRNADAGATDAQAEIFARHVDQLKGAGCDVAAVTSLNGHFCIRQLEARSSLPLINIVTVLERHFQDADVARVGVLGTRATMNSRLCGVAGAEIITPDPEEIDAVDAAYMSLVTNGAATDAERRFLFDAGKKLCARGAEVVALAGTDLFLAFDGFDPGYKVIDCARVHIAALLDYSLR